MNFLLLVSIFAISLNAAPYEDRPYDVDPVISADSYILNFKAPEERNSIYIGTYVGHGAE